MARAAARWRGGRSRPARALSAAQALGPFFAIAAHPGPGWVQPRPPSWSVGRCGSGSPTFAPLSLRHLAHPTWTGVWPRPSRISGWWPASCPRRFGAALMGGVLPVSAPEDVHLHLMGANPVPMALSAARTVPVAGPAALADALDRSWLVPAVRPLSMEVASSTGLSRLVLEGNTISASPVRCAWRPPRLRSAEPSLRRRSTLFSPTARWPAPARAAATAVSSAAPAACCTGCPAPACAVTASSLRPIDPEAHGGGVV